MILSPYNARVKKNISWQIIFCAAARAAKGEMSMTNESYANLPDILNANMLAETLGISRAGAYQLLNSADFPTLQIGKRKLVPKDKLIAWIDRHTGGDAFAC